jgi:hypothetical protein
MQAHLLPRICHHWPAHRPCHHHIHLQTGAPWGLGTAGGGGGEEQKEGGRRQVGVGGGGGAGVEGVGMVRAVLHIHHVIIIFICVQGCLGPGDCRGGGSRQGHGKGRGVGAGEVEANVGKGEWVNIDEVTSAVQSCTYTRARSSAHHTTFVTSA